MDQYDQLDPIEASLGKLSEAEKAGVFRRTRIDARSLLHSRQGDTVARRRLLAVRWVSIAAVLAIAATICGWIFSTPGRPSRNLTTLASNGCDGTFFGCLTGPTGSLSSACRNHDYDADGDVDMVDARTYQASCPGITR